MSANDNKSSSTKMNDSSSNTSQSSVETDQLFSLFAEFFEKHGRQKSTLEDSLMHHLSDSKMKDDYGNALLAIGERDVSKKFDNYTFDNDTLNYMLWTTLYNDSWVFKRVIDKPAQDMVSCGIRIKGDKDYTKIYKIINEHSSDLIELLQWGYLYGGSIAVMMFSGISLKDMKKPIQYSKINKSSKYLLRMYVTDRWYGCSPSYDNLVTNPENIDFGKPKYYNVTFSDGKTYKIHHSYILRYEHRSAPKFVKNGVLQGWGYAEGSHLLNELMRDDKLKASIQSLIDKSLIEIIKMAGMKGLFMSNDPNAKAQIEKRLQMVNWGRNFNSLTFLDVDDSYEMNSFSGLGGLADLLAQNMWLVSAAAEMQGILYGHLNNGFSGDEDAEERWSSTIKGRCNNWYRPVMNKFLSTLFRVFDINDEEISYEFKSLHEDIENDKEVDAISKLTSVLSTMLENGYVTPEQCGKTIQRYVETNTVDFGIDDKSLAKAIDESGSELDGIDLDK